MIHLTAPNDIRWESIEIRDKTFVQTTKQDIQEKGLLLPQRIQDTFLKYADEIDFYYRDEVNKDAILAAKWMRNTKGPINNLRIINEVSYASIKTQHNTATQLLERPDLLWEKTVEKH